MNIQQRLCSIFIGLALVALSQPAWSASAWEQAVWNETGYAPEETGPPKLCLAEQVSYHSNLFRLYDGASSSSSASSTAGVIQALGPNNSRTDTVMQTSACANADWHASQQELLLNLNVEDNRYRRNRMLNHTAGLGKLLWNWRTAGDWYGQIGGNYVHALSNFSVDRPLVKDMVDSYEYFGELNHDFGAHLKVNVGGARTDTSHDTVERRIDNYRSTSGDAGITLTSLADNYIGANFRRTRATYPVNVIINSLAVNRDYQEDASSVRFGYAFTSKTMLHGSADYLKREYLHASNNDFSGGVWRVDLDWLPTDKTKFNFAAWKELGSYFDLEGNHFVSRGGSISPGWTPRDKLRFAALIGWAEQRYLANSLTAAITAPRKDKVLTAGLDIVYQPLDFLDFDARYSQEHHNSNLTVYDFDDQVSSLRIRARF